MRKETVYQFCFVACATMLLGIPSTVAQNAGSYPHLAVLPEGSLVNQIEVRPYTNWTRFRVAATSFVNPKSLDNTFIGAMVEDDAILKSQTTKIWVQEEFIKGNAFPGALIDKNFYALDADKLGCDFSDAKCIKDFLVDSGTENVEIKYFSTSEPPMDVVEFTKEYFARPNNDAFRKTE